VTIIQARLGLLQRVLPVYRAPFFDALARECSGGLSVFAGLARRVESIEGSQALEAARLVRARNIHLLGGKFYLCWQAGVLHWLKDWQPDVLIAEANPRYLHTLQAAAWMHACHCPVIGWGLGVPRQNRAFKPLRHAYLSHFDALITYSRKGAEEYAAAGFPAERIFVAPNAVSPAPTHPLPERSPVFDERGPAVLFVGRLQARKRIDFLLRACASIPEGSQPRLWIAGDGPDRARLEALAKRVYPQARFFGSLYGAELEELFRTADLFVLPGTGGLAVQQAMSFGLPVMVAEADGTQTDLVRPENGWTLPPGDLEALKYTLQDALLYPARLRRMGAASYQIVSTEINLENMVRVFAQAVKSARGESKDLPPAEIL
jgi:glycosyltransferase involved in cell wall biosynthesis